MPSSPTISVIVPAYNAAEVIADCVQALRRAQPPAHELFVVDDRSTDDTAAIARRCGATVLVAGRHGGASAARNLAARQSSGDVLLFIDADVVVADDTLARVARHFVQEPPPDAVFGSYDDRPAAPNFMSQYKNLQHHFVHQHAREDASTFWTGCGAVRRDLFLRLGGFDEQIAFMEDIELGGRIKAAGHRIVLDKELTVTHLKRWTLRSVIWTDIFGRAVPWTKLILESGQITSDLNLKTADRLSAALAWLAVLATAASPVEPRLLGLAGVCLALVLVLNRGFYLYLWRLRGPLFALRVIPVHLLYYLYSAATFGACWVRYRLFSRR